MARCRECNAKVWRNAEYCQHCGVRSPANAPLVPSDLGPPQDRQRGSAGRVIGFLIVIGVLGWIGVNLGSGGGSVATSGPSCKTNWTLCIDNSDLENNYLVDSTAPFECKQEAIKRAKYGDPKFPWAYPFSTFYKGDQYPKTGIAILIEKEAQYQNGFGAMAHTRVECTYDLRAKKVLNIDISAD
jgi:hypothetical protein